VSVVAPGVMRSLPLDGGAVSCMETFLEKDEQIRDQVATARVTPSVSSTYAELRGGQK
jgi:hypothetical protein